MNKFLNGNPELKFSRARSTLLSVVIFTAVNLIMTALETGYFFLFSATVPLALFAFGQSMFADVGIALPTIVAPALAFGVIALYFICWLLSKRRRVFILVALILFVIDCALFAVITFTFGFEIIDTINIAIHVIILCSLISGVVAWTRLRRVSCGEPAAEAPNMSKYDVEQR
ncbi:MAG: hypothetical protein LBC78_00190 [Oscillospiraceae bacterium]|nr:hypothetical protein [Oscillospiraceae bacterium]